MKGVITKCSDNLLWYANHVGLEVKIMRADNLAYWVKDHQGYSNIVKPDDIQIIKESPDD